MMMTSFPNLLSHFRQAAAQHQDLLTTFQAILPDIVAALPGAQAALLYRLAVEGWVLRVATRPDAPLDTFYPAAVLPLHTEAAQLRQTRMHLSQQSLLAPIVLYDTPEAILEVVFDVRAADSVDWLTALAEQVSFALENQFLRDMFQRLGNATTQLSACTTYAQIAEVLGKTLTRRGQFVSINLFERDDHNRLSGMKILASANRHQAYADPIQQPLSAASQQVYAEMMQNKAGILILDTQTDNRIDDTLKMWLKSQDIKSLFLLPMHSGGQVMGNIAINDTQRALIYTQLERQMLLTLAEQAAVAVQNQQFLGEIRASEAASRQQVQILQLLNELSNAASTEQDEQKLLDKATQRLVEITQLNQCGIALLDRDGNVATVRSVYPPGQAIGVKIEAGDNVAALLRETKQPLVVTQVATDERLTPQTRQFLQSEGSQSALFFPLYDPQQQLIGTVGLDSYHLIEQFDPDIIRRAETLVAQVGVNLQKIRLLQDTRRQAEQMQRINAFSQTVQSRLEVAGIIQIMLEHAPRIITPLDYLSLLIFNPLSGLLEEMAFWQAQPGQIIQPGRPIQRDANILAWTAWDNQTFIAVDDLHHSPRHIHPQEQRLRTVVVAPVMTGKNSQGLLEVGAIAPFAYSAADIAAVQQMSNQVGVALANAAAFAYSQEEAEQKALSGRITALLQQQVDLNSILTVTAQELGKALGAKRARIRMGIQPPENGKSS
jgi:GAF domain-containing protein